MAAQSESFDVAVVGGGAIGLACAWRAQQRGARVVVIDAGEPGAWHVAAGMLAPVSEAEFGERALLRARAGERAPLRGRSAPRSRTRATARSARWSSRATATRPRRSTASPSSAAGSGCRSSGCARRRRARLEPALAPTIRLALDIEGDHSIDPRKLVAALRRAFSGEPRRARAHRPARRGRARHRRVSSRTARSPRTRSSSPPACTSPSSTCPSTPASRCGPVKGQVLRLRDPRGPGLVERTIRGEQAYLVPRGDGALRARRDDGGARLGHDADRRRRLRAAARPVARSSPASSSSRSRS